MTQQWADEWQSVGRKKVAKQAQGTASDEGAHSSGGQGASAGDEQPSPRLWLSRLLPNVTDEAVIAVLSRFGKLTDTEVFPSPRGPLKFAFVTFARLEDAMQAYETLSNQLVPTLSGRVRLKIRYNPAEGGRQPSRQQQGNAPAAKGRAPTAATRNSSSGSFVAAVGSASGKGISSKPLPGAIRPAPAAAAAAASSPAQQAALPAQPSGGSSSVWPSFPDPWQAPALPDPWQAVGAAAAPAAGKDPWAGLVAAARQHWPAAGEPAAAAPAAATQPGAHAQLAGAAGGGMPGGGWGAVSAVPPPLGGITVQLPADHGLQQGWGGAGGEEGEEDAELRHMLSLLCT